MAKKLSKSEKARQRRDEAAAGGKGRGRGGATSGAARGRSSMLPLEQQLAFQSRKRTTQQEESAFSKLSPPVIEKLNLISSYTNLERPVNPALVTFGWDRFGRARQEHEAKQKAGQEAGKVVSESHPLQDWLTSSIKKNGQDVDSDSDSDTTPIVVHHGPEQSGELRLPKRPKWHSDMDTKTVQSNEAQVFRAWLQQTDRVVEHAFFTSSPLFKDLDSPFHNSSVMASGKMGGSRITATIPSIDEIKQQRPESGTAIIGSLYERNIEVYRQLWRVCERSDLICVLADARCPTLHLPPSLTAFLERYMRLKVVIVLTKADIVPKPIVNAWKVWLKQRFPRWEVVGTESYTKLERLEGQGQRTRYTPYLSAESCADLFSALRKAHHDFVTPPAIVRDNPERLKRWSPSCATEIDWDGIERMVKSRATVDQAESDQSIPVEDESDRDDHDDEESHDATSEQQPKRQPPPYLTVGLIGQPNVGKSSLLNALFGSKVVRASKTPGKTKHFQTHFLTTNTEKDKRGQIRLCDSPGLVFPSLVGMETQVMGAILPISQVQAVSSAVRYVAQHMPLEKVLGLDFPHSDDIPQHKALKTKEEGEKEDWTAAHILEAVAMRYQWKTAKANRWDTNRAGNLTMRAVAEGKIRWAFRPPTNNGLIENEVLDAAVKAGEGIWLDGVAVSAFDKQEREHVEDVLMMQNHRDQDLEEEEEEPEAEEDDDKPSKQVRFKGETDEASEDEEKVVIEPTTSRFAALAVEDDDDEETSEEEE